MNSQLNKKFQLHKLAKNLIILKNIITIIITIITYINIKILNKKKINFYLNLYNKVRLKSISHRLFINQSFKMGINKWIKWALNKKSYNINLTIKILHKKKSNNHLMEVYTLILMELSSHNYHHLENSDNFLNMFN